MDKQKMIIILFIMINLFVLYKIYSKTKIIDKMNNQKPYLLINTNPNSCAHSNYEYNSVANELQNPIMSLNPDNYAIMAGENFTPPISIMPISGNNYDLVYS